MSGQTKCRTEKNMIFLKEASRYSPKSQDSAVHVALYDRQVSSQSEALEELLQSYKHHSSVSIDQSLHTCITIIKIQISYDTYLFTLLDDKRKEVNDMEVVLKCIYKVLLKKMKTL